MIDAATKARALAFCDRIWPSLVVHDASADSQCFTRGWFTAPGIPKGQYTLLGACAIGAILAARGNRTAERIVMQHVRSFLDTTREGGVVEGSPPAPYDISTFESMRMLYMILRLNPHFPTAFEKEVLEAMRGMARWLDRSSSVEWWSNGNVDVCYASAIAGLAILDRDQPGSDWPDLHERQMEFIEHPTKGSLTGWVVTEDTAAGDPLAKTKGKGYFQETGQWGAGFDPEYTMLAMQYLAHWALDGEPRALKYLSMTWRQMESRIDKARDPMTLKCWWVDLSGGTRKNGPPLSAPAAWRPFFGLAPYVLYTSGIRPDLVGVTDSLNYWENYLLPVGTSGGNPGDYRSLLDVAAVLLP